MDVRQADLVEKTETWTAFVCGCGIVWVSVGSRASVGSWATYRRRFQPTSTIPQLLFEPALGVYPVISRWMPIVLDGKYAVSML